jgi:GMP synthase (glutamine-hydrolysing)
MSLLDAAKARGLWQMRKLLVLQHARRRPMGVLDALLRASGLRLRFVNFAYDHHVRVDLNRYDGVIVLGGPMNVDEQDRYPHLSYEIELLQAAIDRSMPTLGICLGAQLLASALGARVAPTPQPEIGWHPLTLTEAATQDPLLQHINPSVPVFQWHSYTFEHPDRAVHLASSAQCANQAFAYRGFAYGLQFHLEADPHLIDSWLQSPDLSRELEALGGQQAIERIQHHTRQFADASMRQARAVFGAFLSRFNARPPRKIRRLPSGHAHHRDSKNT